MEELVACKTIKKKEKKEKKRKKRQILNWILVGKKEHFKLKKENWHQKEVNIGKGEKMQAKAFQKILP